MNRTVPNGLELSADEKRALLTDLLRQKAARPRAAPVSFAQQRLWFLSRLEPDSPAYNIPRPLRLQGQLNTTALHQTLNQIVARHDILRGSFDLVDGHPVQLIAPRLEIELPIVDLTSFSKDAREAEVSRLAIADAQTPFDLTRPPLFRVGLLKLGELDHVLLLTMHHIVSDGWSLGLFVKELAAIYQAVSRNEPAPLRPLPIQYPDFARWQREWLQGKVLEEQLRYWTGHLAGAPPALNLAVAKSRPAMQTFRGSHLTRTLTPSLGRQLAELSRREGVTLFMTLLAAFKTLLFRYSGQEDLVVGSPIAGRNRAETENLIGFFVNTLPLRTRLSGNPTFRELLKRVKETALGAYAHQDLPFEKIVEWAQPERSLSYPPVFQVMFALQNQPRPTFALPGLNVSALKRETDTAKFDLTLFVTETDEGLACWLEYNTDLFSAGAMTQLLEHFEILLAGVVASPEQQIAELPLLNEPKRQQLLREWNQTAIPYERESCLHELFEAQVARSPDAVALAFQGMELTYRHLNEKANQLAWYLKRRGVGPESLVGICIERSLEMVIGLLGIIKAGGAYLPLDPAYPAERLGFMLADANPEILLTERKLLGSLPSSESSPICLDCEWDQIEAESKTNLTNQTSGQNMAYVIYTSGSTGRPKGVVNTHEAICNRLLWMQDAYGLTPADRVLQKTPFSFDVSVWEFFWPLLAGARLGIAEPGGHGDPAYLVAVINEQKITTLHFVPSMLKAFLEYEGATTCHSLKRVISSGEALSFDLVQRFFDCLKAELHNLYGPTEAAVDVSFWPCSVTSSNQVVPIGRPISNLRLYVLDSYLQPVPIGLPGELYIGGLGLARGYFNKPDLTADRFGPDPFGSAGTRLYRTGDLVRYLPDGNVEYLERIDHQVKLRGFRIELGEIESVLSQHAGVHACVVTLRDGAQGDKQLVAYITLRGAHQPNSVELQAFLKSRLPGYMVPSLFVAMETWPLTVSGKVDRRALPEPERTRPESAQSRLAPRDELEERLVRIWQRVLDLESVCINDNFFELGGHSLLAVRLMSEVEKEFDRKIPLVSLFQSATILGLAKILRRDADSFAWPTLIEIQVGGAAAPLFCVSTPNVNVLGYRSLARYLGSDQTVYGLQAHYPEDLEGEHSQAAVDDLATEYLEAMRAVQPHGPYQFVGMCRGAHIAYEMARRLHDAGEKVALVGVLDTWVMENTYNRFLYVEYYARRLASLLRKNPREQWALISAIVSQRIRNAVRAPGAGDSNVVGSGSAAVGRKRLQETYFPGPDFKPRLYDGRVSVFRAHGQPLNRIRDKELGWGRMATGGVDLEYVPGQHGASLLSEPHVQVLATQLRQRLLQGPERR